MYLDNCVNPTYTSIAIRPVNRHERDICAKKGIDANENPSAKTNISPNAIPKPSRQTSLQRKRGVSNIPIADTTLMLHPIICQIILTV